MKNFIRTVLVYLERFPFFERPFSLGIYGLLVGSNKISTSQKGDSKRETWCISLPSNVSNISLRVV